MAGHKDRDETVRLARPVGGRAGWRPSSWIFAAALLLVGGVGIGVGLWLPHPGQIVAPLPVPQPVPPPPRPRSALPQPHVVAPTQPAPLYPVHAGDEADILADQPERLSVFRFTPNPRVLVLDFPSLRQQGLMLNRIAALVEKAGQPRDRVLTDTELDAAIRAANETIESYYYGHDYRAADLARFFALASRDHVVLTLEEEQLRALLRQEGWLAGEAVGALISIPRVGSEQFIDATARATILHHELSHGEYFTNPAYAAFTARFWRSAMSEDDRARFRLFLGNQGYDTGQEDLMMNEMQAYLMHTPDKRFFNARAVGLSDDRLARLRAEFLADMPRGWLRDETPPPLLPAVATPVRAPRGRRRSAQSRGPVVRTSASTARWTLRRSAVSIAP